MSTPSKPPSTASTQETSPLIPSSDSHPRPGKSLMTAPPSALDPTTAALVAWAEEKEKQYPGAHGSFGDGSTTGMSWGAESWILPHKGDTPLPPDQGKPEIVGGVGNDGEVAKGGKRNEEKGRRLGGLFKGKGEMDGGEGKLK